MSPMRPTKLPTGGSNPSKKKPAPRASAPPRESDLLDLSRLEELEAFKGGKVEIQDPPEEWLREWRKRHGLPER